MRRATSAVRYLRHVCRDVQRCPAMSAPFRMRGDVRCDAMSRPCEAMITRCCVNQNVTRQRMPVYERRTRCLTPICAEPLERREGSARRVCWFTPKRHPPSPINTCHRMRNTNANTRGLVYGERQMPACQACAVRRRAACNLLCFVKRYERSKPQRTKKLEERVRGQR